MECDKKENREEDEAVTTSHLKTNIKNILT